MLFSANKLGDHTFELQSFRRCCTSLSQLMSQQSTPSASLRSSSLRMSPAKASTWAMCQRRTRRRCAGRPFADILLGFGQSRHWANKPAGEIFFCAQHTLHNDGVISLMNYSQRLLNIYQCG